MSHYKSNVRDLEFNLFEVLDLDKAIATGAFGDLDGDTVREMLGEAAKLAQGPVAESFADGDRNPPTFDPETHVVKLPESFKKSLRAWRKGEWFRIGLDEHVGGVPAPAMVAWAINEFVLGANPAVFMYLAGPQFAGILYDIGNEQQRQWAAMAIDRNWGATMVLTEPDAGSDVGAERTKAIEQPDGSWHVEGVKRFITNGDSDDLFENIMHIVLARPQGAGPGTKGLSLFLVPKFLPDPKTGEPGKRNGVFVTGLEHKMGLKVSATTELTFGEQGLPATGWLVGDIHNGIAQMFKVIEYARMFVGVKAISTLSTGYLNALDFAKTRVQGADLTQMTDKTAPRVTIIHHPDVRRALLIPEGLRRGPASALSLYRRPPGPDCRRDRLRRGRRAGSPRQRLLLPLVKGVGSERAYQHLTESLQTLGGSGFLQDYPIEQYIRDAKIDSLYEGTTAIQSQDFFFRKIARDRGVALGHVVGQVQKFLDSDTARPELADNRKLLAEAVEDLQAMVAALTGYLLDSAHNARELYLVGLEAVPFLLAVGDVLIGWLLLQQAEIALNALDSAAAQDDRAFYSGKVATATFFAKNMLPRLAAQRRIIDAVDLTVMEMPEEAF